MDKVIEKIKLTNVQNPTKSREIDAVVDTGTTMLVLPADLIHDLGLQKFKDVNVRYANNQKHKKGVYGVLTVELQGRSGHFDALEEESGSQPLIGQVVLEQLDLVVDAKNKRLTPNPESPDIPLLEIL